MQVIISPKAQQQLQQLCEYLETEWSPSVRDQFLFKFDTMINVIAQMPFSFPASEKKPSIRKCVVTHQTIVFYRILKDRVQITTIKDSRQKRRF